MAEGGTKNPPRNRKGGSGHSPPKGARAEDLSRQLHAGFDEGGLDGCLWATLNGHEAGNGGYSQGLA